MSSDVRNIKYIRYKMSERADLCVREERNIDDFSHDDSVDPSLPLLSDADVLDDDGSFPTLSVTALPSTLDNQNVSACMHQ